MNTITVYTFIDLPVLAQYRNLVKIAPGKKIGSHIHKEQLETHEVIAGTGICINDGVELKYEPGVISIFQKASPHEVQAGADGLYLFAKFMPASN